MNDYKKFGYYFDDIMSQIDYMDWLDFTEEFVKPTDKILDLACGSGTLAILLALDKYNVEGLDLSESMIEIAKEKTKINRCHIPYYINDMTNFNLEKKYNAITCYFDSINHLSNLDDVKKCFDCVYNHLEKNGLFIFDVFSNYAYENATTTLSKELLTCSYNWDITISKPNIINHDITIFDNDIQINEKYNEYYYSLDDLLDPRFKLLKISGDFLDFYDNESGRLIIILQKISD